VNGAILMTYGSPASLGRDDVASYMTRVRSGRPPEEDLVTEFQRRYEVIGGSPLIPMTQAQAAALELRLGWPAEAGMRFSEPSITTALRTLVSRGVERVAGIILSPQYSPLLMGGYARAIEAAKAELGPSAPEVVVSGSWHLEPGYVAAVAGRVREGLAEFAPEDRDRVPVLFTAHSLPRRVADQEPGYLAQLSDTATAIAVSVGLPRDRWQFCWQSAGHEPGEWMKPDFADLMPELARAGHRTVLVAPVQFLSDHLEILYDVDIGAREQAESEGMEFHRIRSLNDDPTFIEGLGEVARRTLGAPRDAATAA
jgi:ferrochelatase